MYVRARVLYAFLDIQSSEEGIRVSEICITDVYELKCVGFKQNPWSLQEQQVFLIP